MFHCNPSLVLTVKHSSVTTSNLPPPFYLSVQAGEDGTKRVDDREKHVEEDYSIGFVDQRHVCTYTDAECEGASHLCTYSRDMTHTCCSFESLWKQECTFK